MRVTIIAHTPEPDKVAAAAARLCYSTTSAEKIMENFTEEKAASFIKKLVESGHMSPIEHVNFTFTIDGVSRTLLSQITRHRIASFSVQSLRYNNPFKEELQEDFAKEILPKDIYYLKGYLAFKPGDKTNFYKDTVKKHNLEKNLQQNLKEDYIFSYLRGVFENIGQITPEGISFPVDVLKEVSSINIQFTQRNDKLLIKGENAVKLASKMYADVDYSSIFFDSDKLETLCKKYDKFFEEFIQRAENLVDKKYYAMIPNSVKKSVKTILLYINGLETTKQSYIDMVKAGVHQEDARYILPMGTQTKIVMTMNARSLYNFFSLRCCSRAQKEIQDLANLMLKEVKKIAPMLFESAGAACVANGFCPEGKFSCGRFPTR